KVPHREPPSSGGSLIFLLSAILSDKRFVLRRFTLSVLFRRAPRARQLQHSRALTLAKIGHQHDLAVREFQSIVMSRWPVEIDLPETRNLVRRLARRQEPE